MSYDPTIGRWTAEDPIAFEGRDANLYRYVGNSPTNYTDPFGLQGGRPPYPSQPPVPGSGFPYDLYDRSRPAPPPPLPWEGPLLRNPTAVNDFDELKDFVRKCPKDVPWLDPCFVWATRVDADLPSKFEPNYKGPDKSPINVRRVCWNRVGLLVTGAHTAFEVAFPDGSIIYVDEGGPWSTTAGALGGPDRWFGPNEIPSNYHPIPCNVQVMKR